MVRNFPADWSEKDTRAVDLARVLAADAVEKCGSGHPGTAMSLAPLAYTLYQRVMRHNPKNPTWVGRDRFILSCGHSSLTQYIQLYLGGFGLELEDIKQLRQWGSLTPGHPEVGHTDGVEITTGPLGQGLASAVGMAMAARLEDDTTIAFTEDVAARYEAYGWQVLEVTGEDIESILDAVERAKQEKNKPTFIRMRSVIAYGAPTAVNTGASHGAALGAEEISGVKQNLGFPDEPFPVEEEIIEHTRQLIERGEAAEAEWRKSFDAWAEANPENKALFDRLFAGELPEGFDAELPSYEAGESVATRKASGAALQALAKKMPELWGGSADLAGSNNTLINGENSFGPASISTSTFTASPAGRNLHFGIREHAMGAIINGIALHGPTRPYGATFLQFSDYMRASVRLAALMSTDSYFVWTHDSIGLGEDGPTHQPIEHLAALRAIPNLAVIRPADANETSAAWAEALEAPAAPKALILTRQNVPVLEGTKDKAREGVRRGGYILRESSTEIPQVILIGTGSEVQLAVAAAEALEAEGIGTRVVSMPVVEWFKAQDQAYRDEVLPPSVTGRVSVEAGIAMPWHEFTGFGGRNISIEHFGASADYQRLYQEYGITAEAVADAARELV